MSQNKEKGAWRVRGILLLTIVVCAVYAAVWADGIVCYLQCKSCFYEEKVYFGMGSRAGYMTGYCQDCKKFVSRKVTDAQEIKEAAGEFMCPLCGQQVQALDESTLRKKLRTIDCPKCGLKKLQVQDQYEWE